MPRGSKASYTHKQKRKAEHIEEGYVERGVSRDTAEQRAWATVNKQDGGGKKRGSGRKRSSGRVGWVVLWLLGIPIPVLLALYVLRGCT